MNTDTTFENLMELKKAKYTLRINHNFNHLNDQIINVKIRRETLDAQKWQEKIDNLHWWEYKKEERI